MCLRRVLNIVWRQRVSNIEVLRRTGQPLFTEVIRKRDRAILATSFGWRTQESRTSFNNGSRVGLDRGRRPRNIFRRTCDCDLRSAHTSLQPQWEDVLAAAPIRDVYRGFVDALCAPDGSGGPKF